MGFTKKIVAITLLSAGLSGAATADFVGLNIGATRWSPDIAGSFSSDNAGSSSISAGNDLGYSDHSSTSINISFEHPLPLIPNVKYQGADLNASSTSDTTGITFGDTSYAAGTINSTLDLSHNDIALYYEILDNWINIDIGVDLKMFDGKVSINGTEGIESITVDETIPMIYLSARFDLPLTGF
ncbi:MAG: TIGR04219 family outer membrane beta-barrel protein, partial [Gammaproteobacteria bacterium]|nr:TIGR04219 family outer membrane beta-barrel protein [Gammaproteobacteria bacterium]